MKNVINYYYNLIPDDIHQNQKKYYFDYGGFRYAFILYVGDIFALQEIYNVHMSLLQRGICVHQIILNKDAQIVTFVNGEPFVLLKLCCGEHEITLDNVWAFSTLVADNFFATDYEVGDKRKGIFSAKSGRQTSNFKLLERQNLGMLWSNKCDHFEYQMSQLGQKNPLIRDSFNYFIGLGETAIQLVNSLSYDNITKVIAHERISVEYTLFDLYNPLNLVIDTKVRDVAEFFKNSFFSIKKDERYEYEIDELNHKIYYFLVSSGLTITEFLLFLARMMYPTYYFDLYEKIITNKEDDSAIKKIIDRIDDYENMLRYIYRCYKTFLPMTSIEWLE